MQNNTFKIEFIDTFCRESHIYNKLKEMHFPTNSQSRFSSFRSGLNLSMQVIHKEYIDMFL